MFKRIFGHIGNERITTDLLSSILKKKITNLKLDNNPILEKDMYDDKIGILDIKAKIDNTINCDIEMQVVDHYDIEKRLLFYWSKMYSSSIKSGDNYNIIEKNIVILISDYKLESLKEIPKYVTKWNIREEDFSKIILTDALEIYIIETSKYNKYVKNIENIENKALNNWIEFIKNPEVVDMEKSRKEVKEARKVLEDISQDEHERYLADLREKYILDQKSVEYTGIKKGEIIKTKEIARKLKEQNVDINIIITSTGLSKEEIENL